MNAKEEEEKAVKEICPNCKSLLIWIGKVGLCLDCDFPDEEEVFGNLDDDDE